jgi:nicotinamidase/pyrazinamidase
MARIIPGANDALIVVDVQRDFLPGGALGVARGDEVVAPLNEAARAFERAGRPIFASRDWHPPDHCSFKARGGPWPPHCVAGTAGAGFADADSYSAFGGTDLAAQLRRRGVSRLMVGGLATDYCVLNTVLDARAQGFDVLVLTDAVRAVEVAPGDGERAMAKMKQAGARLEPA